MYYINIYNTKRKEWFYLSHDGTCGINEFIPFILDAKSFNSKDKAEEYWNHVKNSIDQFESDDFNNDFDLNTIAIRKVVFKEIRKLKNDNLVL